MVEKFCSKVVKKSDFSDQMKLCKGSNIVLLGLKGVGKTTVGKKLAEALSWPFLDTDEEMERKWKCGVREMFVRIGETVFREREREIILGMQKREGAIIAVGGGGFLSLENQQVLQDLGKVMCLYMKKEELLARWVEWPPFCQGIEEFHRYYAERMLNLAKFSCIWVDATRKDLVDVIIRVCCGQ